MNSVWVITWKYNDNSSSGVLPECYENYNPAYWLCEQLNAQGYDKSFYVVELKIVKGDLQ